MTLGIFLSLGGSFNDMTKVGQDELFKKFYLSTFVKNFDDVYIFSYGDEKVPNLPPNVHLIPNKLRLHRYIYGFLMPFLNFSSIQKCDVFRTYHLLGTPPAIVNSMFFAKPFIFNFAYDYEKFAKIEGRYFQSILFRLIKPLASFFASKIFAANREIFKKLPPNKAVYLPNGVDTNFFKPQRSKRKNKKPIILSVGRLEKQKNFESLVNAMRGVNAKLIIVGQGSLREELVNLAKRDQVDLKIIEKVPHSQMPKIYNTADIFALSSLTEGSPKALMEAMATALACIGTNTDGIKEIIIHKNNGILTGANPQDIGRAISYLIKHPNIFRDIGKKAREYVVSNFDLKNLLSLEVEALKKVSLHER